MVTVSTGMFLETAKKSKCHKASAGLWSLYQASLLDAILIIVQSGSVAVVRFGYGPYQSSTTERMHHAAKAEA